MQIDEAYLTSCRSVSWQTLQITREMKPNYETESTPLESEMDSFSTNENDKYLLCLQ